VNLGQLAVPQVLLLYQFRKRKPGTCGTRINGTNVLPVTKPVNVKAPKVTQSTNPNQWPGIILSSTTTLLLMNGRGAATLMLALQCQ